MTSQLDSIISFHSLVSHVAGILGDRPLGSHTPSLSRQDPLHRLRDVEILRSQEHWPEIKTMLRGLAGQQLVSFALRHVATRFSLISHSLGSLTPDPHIELPAEEVQLFTEFFATFLAQDRIPILGFDPVGLILRLVPRGLCLAFDSYELPLCSEPGQPYCQHHQGEVWWRGPEFKQQLTQGKMFRFYQDPSHAEAFSDQELARMLDEFWQKLSRVPSQGQLERALAVFGLSKADGSWPVDAGELKRLYRQKCLVSHPDRGGAVEDFRELQESYGTIKRALVG